MSFVVGSSMHGDDTDETISLVSMETSCQDSDVASDASSARVPKGFICPLTMEVMFDPVLDAEGNTYERLAVLEWHYHGSFALLVYLYHDCVPDVCCHYVLPPLATLVQGKSRCDYYYYDKRTN